MVLGQLIALGGLAGDDLRGVAGILFTGQHQSIVLFRTEAGSLVGKGLVHLNGASLVVDLQVQGGGGCSGGVGVDGLHSSYLFLSGLLALSFYFRRLCALRCDYSIYYRKA